MSLMVCPHPTCTGHIAKFTTCRDEAVYLAATDSTVESTGEVDWAVWAALLIVTDSDNELETADFGTKAGRTVKVEPGSYLIREDSGGFVSILHFRDPNAARQHFDTIDSAYADWLGDED